MKHLGSRISDLGSDVFSSAVRDPRWAILLGLLGGCAKAPAPQAVWIDVARLAPSAAPVRRPPTLPRPPAATPARNATLPARPPVRLVSEAGIDGEALAREVDEAQAISLDRLRRRLSEVYGREADRFARQQMRLLGDPYRTAIDRFYPEYRRAFEAYAEKRLAPAVHLAFIVGSKDPNPNDVPVDTKTLTPIGRLLAKRASAARKELRTLDAAFDKVAAEFLDRVATEGDAARAETLARIEKNRDALNRQALAEAARPIGPRGEEAIRLSLARAGVAQVPAVAARSLTLPAIPASPPAPRVESPQALTDARSRLLGEARIWAALQGLRLDPKGRDATTEFAAWNAKRAGASPNSPPPSAGP